MKLPSADEISRYDVEQARSLALTSIKLIPGLVEQNQRQSKVIADLLQKMSDTGQMRFGSNDAINALQLQKLQQMLFGDRSERRVDGLQMPATTDAGAIDKNKKKEDKKSPKRGRTKQPGLPVVSIRHELPKEDLICDRCGGELKAWLGQFEESTMIQMIPARFELEKHLRQKYHGCGCGCIRTALGPLKMKDGSRYTPEFAVEVAVNKYENHLPLDRQVRMMKSAGLKVESQTLFGQVDDLAFYAKPIAERIRDHIRSQKLFFGDETVWKNLANKDGDKANKRFQLWSMNSKNAVSFQIVDSRSSEMAKKIFAGLKGVLMCDAYAGYDCLASAELTLAGCWAHVRREFVYAEKDYPQESKRILNLIRKLYAIETRLKGKSPERVVEVRRRQSRRILNCILRRLHEHRRTLTTMQLGKAVQYALNQWSRLIVFIDNPEVPLDNNPAERSIRGPVVGRKNHYGSKSLP